MKLWLQVMALQFIFTKWLLVQFLNSTHRTVGDMTVQLLRVQTVYRCIIMVIAVSHSTSHYTGLVHMIFTILSAMRMGLSCSWKQLFAVGSTTEVK